MTPEELASQIENRSLNAISRLNKVIISAQNDAYGDVIVVLKKLELDKDGYILQNSANRETLRKANRAFARSIDGSNYLAGLNKFTVTFSVIDDLNSEYFKQFQDFRRNRLFMKDLQRQAISDIESQLLNKGLESQIKIPLSQMLNQNVNAGGSYTGMLEQVKNYIKGNDQVDGRMLRYVNTITKDILFNYSRTYQHAVSSDLGLEFYLYVGGVIDKTRHFCEEKAGKFYHHREIELWAAGEWKGKRPDTTESSIFIYGGGYNCLHQILPVHVSVVPQEVIDRATEMKYYELKKAKTSALVEAD